MKLASAILVALVATAAADPAVDLRWSRVIVDNPQSESAVVTIVYDWTVRVTVDADVDRKLQLCVERALQVVAPLRTRDGVVRQWVTAELVATSTVSDSLMYRGTRQTAPLWIEARAYVPHVDPDQRLWLRGAKIKR